MQVQYSEYRKPAAATPSTPSTPIPPAAVQDAADSALQKTLAAVDAQALADTERQVTLFVVRGGWLYCSHSTVYLCFIRNELKPNRRRRN